MPCRGSPAPALPWGVGGERGGLPPQPGLLPAAAIDSHLHAPVHAATSTGHRQAVQARPWRTAWGKPCRHAPCLGAQARNIRAPVSACQPPARSKASQGERGGREPHSVLEKSLLPVPLASPEALTSMDPNTRLRPAQKHSLPQRPFHPSTARTSGQRRKAYGE